MELVEGFAVAPLVELQVGFGGWLWAGVLVTTPVALALAVALAVTLMVAVALVLGVTVEVTLTVAVGVAVALGVAVELEVVVGVPVVVAVLVMATQVPPAGVSSRPSRSPSPSASCFPINSRENPCTVNPALHTEHRIDEPVRQLVQCAAVHTDEPVVVPVELVLMLGLTVAVAETVELADCEVEPLVEAVELPLHVSVNEVVLDAVLELVLLPLAVAELDADADWEEEPDAEAEGVGDPDADPDDDAEADGVPS